MIAPGSVVHGVARRAAKTGCLGEHRGMLGAAEIKRGRLILV
jgi:hypothetical protein